jgi:hypothetical protein
MVARLQLGSIADRKGDILGEAFTPPWGLYSLLTSGYWGGGGVLFLPGIKLLENEADHAFASNAKVKSTWTSPPRPIFGYGIVFNK